MCVGGGGGGGDSRLATRPWAGATRDLATRAFGTRNLAHLVLNSGYGPETYFVKTLLILLKFKTQQETPF